MRLAAWRSFFLVVPVVHVPFDAAGSLFDGLGPGALGWLLAAGADQLAADDVPGLTRPLRPRRLRRGHRARGTPPEIAETVGISLPAQATAQDLADRVAATAPGCRGPPAEARDAEPAGSACRCAWSAARTATTVDRRNDLAYDGLLITDRD